MTTILAAEPPDRMLMMEAMQASEAVTSSPPLNRIVPWQPHETLATGTHRLPVQGIAYFSTDGGARPPRAASWPRGPVVARSRFDQDVTKHIQYLRQRFPIICNAIFPGYDIRWYFDEHDWHLMGGKFLWTVLDEMRKENEAQLLMVARDWIAANIDNPAFPGPAKHILNAPVNALFSPSQMRACGVPFLEYLRNHMIPQYEDAVARRDAAISASPQQIRTTSVKSTSIHQVGIMPEELPQVVPEFCCSSPEDVVVTMPFSPAKNAMQQSNIETGGSSSVPALEHSLTSTVSGSSSDKDRRKNSKESAIANVLAKEPPRMPASFNQGAQRSQQIPISDRGPRYPSHHGHSRGGHRGGQDFPPRDLLLRTGMHGNQTMVPRFAPVIHPEPDLFQQPLLSGPYGTPHTSGNGQPVFPYFMPGVEGSVFVNPSLHPFVLEGDYASAGPRFFNIPPAPAQNYNIGHNFVEGRTTQPRARRGSRKTSGHGGGGRGRRVSNTQHNSSLFDPNSERRERERHPPDGQHPHRAPGQRLNQGSKPWRSETKHM